MVRAILKTQGIPGIAHASDQQNARSCFDITINRERLGHGSSGTSDNTLSTHSQRIVSTMLTQQNQYHVCWSPAAIPVRPNALTISTSTHRRTAGCR